MSEVLKTNPRFAQPERLTALMDNNPPLVITAIERLLPQETIDALERELFPPLTNTEQAERLTQVLLRFTEIGLAQDDALVQAVQGRIEELTEEPAVEVQP